jgi:hypothetical protein
LTVRGVLAVEDWAEIRRLHLSEGVSAWRGKRAVAGVRRRQASMLAVFAVAWALG